MLNKINCAEKIEKIVDLLETDYDYETILVERECQDSWSENGAIFMVYLIEADYRDYDAIKRDIVDDIVDQLGSEITVLHGMKDKYPNSGYVLNIHEKSGGLAVEFEFHRVENGRPV